jgi:hypothetical protein
MPTFTDREIGTLFGINTVQILGYTLARAMLGGKCRWARC